MCRPDGTSFPIAERSWWGCTIALSERYLFVADYENARVRIHRHDRSLVRMLPIEAWHIGVFVSRNHLLLAGSVISRLCVVDFYGGLISTMNFGWEVCGFAIGVDEVYVMAPEHQVHVLGFDGEFRRTFPVRGCRMRNFVVRDYLWTSNGMGDGQTSDLRRPDGSLETMVYIPRTCRVAISTKTTHLFTDEMTKGEKKALLESLVNFLTQQTPHLFETEPWFLLCDPNALSPRS